MAEILIKNNKAISIGTVECEEDLKTIPGHFNINPPPQDGKCQCCGKHISELKPFGGPGDPLVGDFTGAYLIKKFRPDGPYDEEAENASREAERKFKEDGFSDPLDWMIDRYGTEKGKRLYYTDMAFHSVGKSWECRDCAILDHNEYHEKLRQRHESSTVSSSQKA